MGSQPVKALCILCSIMFYNAYVVYYTVKVIFVNNVMSSRLSEVWILHSSISGGIFDW